MDLQLGLRLGLGGWQMVVVFRLMSGLLTGMGLGGWAMVAVYRFDNEGLQG